MAEPATIPITVTPEAAERIAELGVQAEFQQMVDRALQLVPAVKRIEVVLEPAYDTGDDPYLLIYAFHGGPWESGYAAGEKWADWKTFAFHPDVHRHFTLWTHPETDHAR
jgi:hypothetical protein